MIPSRVLIANRGEVVARVASSAADLGVGSVGVFAADDAGAPWLARVDATAALPGRGPSAYLDGAAILTAASAAGCDALHPGWGFLSERADFAQACRDAGLIFVGPSTAALAVLGDKARARAVAGDCGIPVPDGADNLATARALVARGPVLVKAGAGGGGRGMRAVDDPAALDAAWSACAREARAAFGDSGVHAERLIAPARHIEVQIAADGAAAIALGGRDCTLQRRRQKLVQFSADLPAGMAEATCAMARRVGYRGLGTWEFVVDRDGAWWFIEVNPRLQVEHTVTEAVTGLDLVALQFRLAAGESLEGCGVTAPPVPRGCAVQLRLNAEHMAADGTVRPQSGTLAVFEPPGGPGVRVDHAAAAGYAPNPAFDSLLAKLVVTGGTRAAALRRASRALDAFRIEGIGTNRALLRALLVRPEVVAATDDTAFVEAHAAELVRHADSDQTMALAEIAPEGLCAAVAPIGGVLASLECAVGAGVRAGETLALIEAMKMQVPVVAPVAGTVRTILVEPGRVIPEGVTIATIAPADATGPDAVDPSANPRERDDLRALRERLRAISDAGRAEAVARRRDNGKRTARENLADLFDAGSFNEYGALAVAAQRRRRSMEELIRVSPADGLICGVGAVDGRPCAAMAYDYTVLAGTQGFLNHRKTDRLLGVVARERLPLVLFAEGGGGRPGDTDVIAVAGLDLTTFVRFAALSGCVPMLGVAAGYCFAGNAALLGCCDLIVATPDASIGMGGPAMIEGGGLGVVRPENVGPVGTQTVNGVIDLLVADEREAVAFARRYLALLRGPALDEAPHADPARLRDALPADRKRAYDMRALIAGVFDSGGVTELRRGFAPPMITALARLDGIAVGVIANDPMRLGGAIDAAAADKAARFLQICDAHGLPVVSLCDTPGFMVGVEAERAAQVRHASRLFVIGAALTVPVFCVIVRKGYGLGAMAMAAGGFHETGLTVAWPSGEFGGMGLEGAVRLGYRRELDAAPEAERAALYERLVAELYERGQAINMASLLEIDAVIDPAETRAWLARGLRARAANPGTRARRYIDPW